MNPFLERMRLLPDQELIALITERAEEYRPEALEAAKAVLQERQIDPQAVLAAYAQSQQEPEEIIQQRLEQGESLDAIVSSLHEQKLDSFEILNKEDEALERNNPIEHTRRHTKWKRLGGWFLLVLGVLRFLLGLPNFGLNAWSFKTIGFILIGLWLLAETSGGLRRANKEKPL